MINLNPETRSSFWTKEIVDAAKEKYKNQKPYPVVVISYKRGGNASTLKLLKDTEVPVYLFVYDDDYENYKNVVETSSNIKVVLCPSKEFRGAAKKRDYVQDTMYASNFKDYFILDDDISALYYTEVGTTKAGKYKAQKVKLTPKEFFDTWYYVIHDILKDTQNYEITLGGIIAEFASWGQNLYKLPVSDKTGRICQIMYINAEKFAENNIKYVETQSWDDFDVMLQVLNDGLHISQIRWLTYAGDTMNPNNSVASGGDFTWTKKSMRLYQKWGDCVGFKADKGQLNTTISWSKIKKDIQVLGKLNVTYKEEWKPYFETTMTENNPFGLDWRGFTELWRPEIEKWLEKHPQKVKKSKKKEEKVVYESLTDSIEANKVQEPDVKITKSSEALNEMTPADRELLNDYAKKDLASIDTFMQETDKHVLNDLASINNDLDNILNDSVIKGDNNE